MAATTLSAIRDELKTIEKWDGEFQEFDDVDEIGRECRRIRREELLSMFYWRALRN